MLAQAGVRIQSPSEDAGFAIPGDQDECRVFVLRGLRWIPVTGFGDESFVQGMCGAAGSGESRACQASRAVHKMTSVERVISFGPSCGPRRICVRAAKRGAALKHRIIFRPEPIPDESTEYRVRFHLTGFDRRKPLRMQALQTNALARPGESRRMRTRPTEFPGASTRNAFLSEEMLRWRASRCLCPQADFR
jgi:hypothetical protein